MMPPLINDRTILNGLTAGFALVMVLLSLAAFVAVHRSQDIQTTAASSVAEHLAAARVMDEFQIQQETMGQLLFDLLDSESNSHALAARIKALKQDLERISPPDSRPEIDALWKELRSEGHAFASAGSALLKTDPKQRDNVERDLEHHYDRFVNLSTKVLRTQQANASRLENQIQLQSAGLRTHSVWLLGSCLALSLAGAIVTIRLTARSFETMRWQAEELNRVSWQMLESQEDTARRFAHEMHDELGQSLTGLKAVLQGISPGDFGARRPHCIDLLDESIRNVRELSQLLRPVVLDDFGLEAALRWLSERFQERTRIDVAYESHLSGRLPDQTETHLFRITQEALTNIARHSGATKTRISIGEESGRAVLVIEDNGRGLQQADTISAPSLGIVGMRARARQVGGALHIENIASGGVRISVWAPFERTISHADKEDAHSVSGRS